MPIFTFLPVIYGWMYNNHVSDEVQLVFRVVNLTVTLKTYHYISYIDINTLDYEVTMRD